MKLTHQFRNARHKVAGGLFSLFLDRKIGQCGSENKVKREVWLKHALAKIPAKSRILDAGAGELQYKRFCAHLKYVSQDFAQYNGQGDGLGLQTRSWNQSDLDIVSDITKIPEPDASFDAVMCVEVLEHVPNPVNVLKEFSRLLRPGGALIITAPFCAVSHLTPFFYQTGYSRYFYEYWLKKIGFEIVEMQWNGNYFEYLAQELRRLPQIGQKYAGKTATWLDKTAINLALAFLNRLSRRNRGSEHLLAYGLHIFAKKVGSSNCTSAN
jgi:SAM-dependent methyltransferase